MHDYVCAVSTMERCSIFYSRPLASLLLFSPYLKQSMSKDNWHLESQELLREVTLTLTTCMKCGTIKYSKMLESHGVWKAQQHHIC